MNEQNNGPVEEDKSKNIKTHSQAIYTSRLLSFENLPEPVNSSDSLTFHSGNAQFYLLIYRYINIFFFSLLIFYFFSIIDATANPSECILNHDYCVTNLNVM